jgi:hypothetical protein
MTHKTGCIIIISFFILAYPGCMGRQGPGLTGHSFEADSSLLFNGLDLEGWEITNFGPQGSVHVSDGLVYLGMGDGCTGITYKKEFPVINYKVTLEVQRVSGNDFFCGMTFPVDKEPCTLIIGGWGGGVVGLSSVDGMDASENETYTLMKFQNKKWYKICLEVKSDSIKTWINDSLVIGFEKAGRRLSIRPEVELSKPFGICSWNTTAAIKDIRIKRLEVH